MYLAFTTAQVAESNVLIENTNRVLNTPEGVSIQSKSIEPIVTVAMLGIAECNGYEVTHDLLVLMLMCYQLGAARTHLENKLERMMKE